MKFVCHAYCITHLITIMPASQLHFLANKNAKLAVGVLNSAYNLGVRLIMHAIAKGKGSVVKIDIWDGEKNLFVCE